VLQKADSTFSVRKWAKEMELKSHSLLAMLLQGKRDIRIQHWEFLKKGLELPTGEQAYFQTLIQYSNCKTIEEKSLINGFLQDLHPGDNFATKDVSEYIAISNWVYMAILAMTELKDFKGTEEEICVRLGGKVVISEIRSAMIRLLDLKLVKWSEDGKLEATFNRVTSKNDVANEGVKEYHRQVLDLAKIAIDEQGVQEREFQSFTMAIAREKLPLAKDMIRKFRSKLSKAVSGDGDNVYQTSIQLFQLTSNPDEVSEVKNVARDSKQQGKQNVN
jgi:uncharacterized protein (TIGR02147 family)